MKAHLNQIAVTILSLVVAGLTPAGALASNLSPETRACLFAQPIAFGASVTQATTYVIPAYKGVVRAVELYGQQFGQSKGDEPKPSIPPVPTTSSRPYGLSPVRYVTKALAGKAALSQIQYIGSYVTQKPEHLGSSQIESLLRGDRQAMYSKTKLLVGVDAFYWDAVWNRCATGEPQAQIQNLIASAKANDKTLVLGTVPIEYPDLVRINSQRTTVQGLWYNPHPPCVRVINALLEKHCTLENHCYLVDMKGTVDHLAAGGKLPLFGQGEYGYFDVRPDGVHLSDVGAKIVAEIILGAFEAHPPSCTSPNL